VKRDGEGEKLKMQRRQAAGENVEISASANACHLSGVINGGSAL
jgi:hypothetical protein